MCVGAWRDDFFCACLPCHAPNAGVLTLRHVPRDAPLTVSSPGDAGSVAVVYKPLPAKARRARPVDPSSPDRSGASRVR